MQTVVETPSYPSDADRLFPRTSGRLLWIGSRPIQLAERSFLGATESARCVSASERVARVVAPIIYLFSGESLPVFVLADFAKNEKANLSTAERNALGNLVEQMIRGYRAG
jgi:hypothetical protein